MHLALVIQSVRVVRGGAERFTHNLIRGLLARGHRISVVCYEWDREAEELGIELIRVPRLRGWGHPWYEFSRSAWRVMPRCDVVVGLTQVCPQDVHRLGGGIYRYWYERKYGRWLPLQLLRRDVRGALAFEREMYREGNYRQCIAISAMDRELLMRYYGIPGERVHTVYNGFDREVFHGRGREEARRELCMQYGIEEGQVIVLFAGNNYVRKGLPQGVEALLRTKDPGRFTLVVIGKPQLGVKRRLQARCAGRVRSIWLDHVEDPARYYRGADVLLFPTLYDSFANVIGEALCCGLPVITTRQAGGAEMIEPGVNGFVVREADAVDELAYALERVREPEVRAAMTARAGMRVEACTIARCAEETERVLWLAWEEKQRIRRAGEEG